MRSVAFWSFNDFETTGIALLGYFEYAVWYGIRIESRLKWVQFPHLKSNARVGPADRRKTV